MMESVALPGGGGVKAAIKGYRIAIKTGTAKKVGPDGRYINKYIAYTAGVRPPAIRVSTQRLAAMASIARCRLPRLILRFGRARLPGI
ncbi:hypothetical protein CKQ90_10680, partial [Klebsiella pneumoniae]